MRPRHDTALHKAAKLIKKADCLLIGAGAGMGVDSGLPDFRSTNGLWEENHDLIDPNGSPFDLAKATLFKKDPKTAWAFYQHRHQRYTQSLPHAGFNILKKWTEGKKYPCFIFTSNVDGHFQKAGFPESMIEECHGSIHHLQCMDGQCQQPIWHVNNIHEKHMPTCPTCGSLARPNIFMFNDLDWDASRVNKQHTEFERWVGKTNTLKRVAIEIGVGSSITTVRDACKPISDAYIRINPEPHDNLNDINLQMQALDALTVVDKTINSLPRFGLFYL
ncbi:SIR2 family NAD-dependent protein deacylase [Neptuniibacter sp. QD37_11]|uniref:SIR2 family NAD-dependent protein deacylase n=1 Tax=Neptuniibacter sp. QD37_11 TaxID=3398209 RepID=UPI0039F4CBC7